MESPYYPLICPTKLPDWLGNIIGGYLGRYGCFIKVVIPARFRILPAVTCLNTFICLGFIQSVTVILSTGADAGCHCTLRCDCPAQKILDQDRCAPVRGSILRWRVALVMGLQAKCGGHVVLSRWKPRPHCTNHIVRASDSGDGANNRLLRVFFPLRSATCPL